MPQSTRDRLRERFLDTKGHWVPEGPKGKAPSGDLPRRPYVRSDERAIGYVPYEKGELPDPLPATLVAFYLPQFHTIPENDEWWGKGFTEWRNVTRALPQFEGHYQPKLPGDLGFYDLRNVEVMHEQARLAREYGISAFCFYFYWFGGKTLLETPLRNWLNDKTIDLKFCLCWANEKWTRTWDGRGDEILIDQKHSPEDDIAFIEHVAEYMRDPRYLRVDGKPLLMVYRPGLLPSPKATAERWRNWCRQNGVGEIHLMYVQSFERPNPSIFHFDSAIEFPPNLGSPESVTGSLRLINPVFKGAVLDWRTLRKPDDAVDNQSKHIYPGVNPGWDNEARRPGSGRIFLHSAAGRYSRWLRHSIRASAEKHAPLVFINAWNEWAEGAILEPDARFGYANLDATRSALASASPILAERVHPEIHVIVHCWYPELLGEVLKPVMAAGFRHHLIVTTTTCKAEQTRLALVEAGISAKLDVFPNRGRDILPFLTVAARSIRGGADLVLKLHTKKSPHINNGDDWRRELISSLVPGTGAADIPERFSDNPSLGMIGARGHILPLQHFLGANKRELEALCARVGIPLPDYERAVFASGSMFWARASALEPILDAGLCSADFENENGQVDGTLAHSIERLLGWSVQAAGGSIEGAGASGVGARNGSAPSAYPYVS